MCLVLRPSVLLIQLLGWVSWHALRLYLLLPDRSCTTQRVVFRCCWWGSILQSPVLLLVCRALLALQALAVSIQCCPLLARMSQLGRLHLWLWLLRMMLLLWQLVVLRGGRLRSTLLQRRMLLLLATAQLLLLRQRLRCKGLLLVELLLLVQGLATWLHSSVVAASVPWQCRLYLLPLLLQLFH
jgi:hypothetical protein